MPASPEDERVSHSDPSCPHLMGGWLPKPLQSQPPPSLKPAGVVAVVGVWVVVQVR